MRRRGRLPVAPFLLGLLVYSACPPLAGFARPAPSHRSASRRPSAVTAAATGMPSAPTVRPASVRFSHVHIYADSLRPVKDYKLLEGKLCAFAAGLCPQKGGNFNLPDGRSQWVGLAKEHGSPVTGEANPEAWSPSAQDVVEQLLVGLGWRVTGACASEDTHSVLVTSPDPDGVKFVVTAHAKHGMGDLPGVEQEGAPAKRAKVGTNDLYGASQLERFARHRAGRAGIAVLGFETAEGGVQAIFEKYKELHPKLLVTESPQEHPGAIVLEVYAYYKGEKQVSEEDRGTLLRFVEVTGSGKIDVLPGMQPVDATFDATGVASYHDHWVSNVVSRTGFLDTLNDTLGFTPKVDFNAGVVAAGEAQIESTVTGNDPGTLLSDAEMGLKDQSQVYLPTNNALSEVGHVKLYLNEIGQGVQHIASRVADLPALVQRSNDFRKMTGAGLSFLSIPRSYYGCLTAQLLAQESGIDVPAAEACLRGLKEAGIVDADVVDLDATRERVAAALPEGTDAAVAEHVLRARYGNLYALLRDNVGEAMYLKIVRNNVLVDIQGGDLLMQIFTSKILERQTGHEAPFLEFIQRICSDCVDPATCKPKQIKPGCGGFGIRNFLTLFLSIEVSKAAKAREDARAAGDAKGEARFSQMVNAFTAQLDESNPVLTAISDAMTAEGKALDRGDTAEVQRWAAEKVKGNEALQAISLRYKLRMKELREGVSPPCAPA